MDYDKKYKEALEKARIAYNKITPKNTAVKKLLEESFPELAESEDERIRKEIISALKFANDGGVYDKHIAYLEKQEEQKENPKSADSISSDCVSDAKCEDRWHKVEDSLPDNGREVLAKDKLGNTLLARYDGEGWDVSVYDDEDYRCHNGISKWCEIPFEKPKEQEPNIELIKRSWYMEGYNDRDFNKEPRWIIKTGEGGPRYEENPKYGQMLEAEQKPVEYLDKDKVYAIMKKLVKLAAFSQLIPINSEEYKMIDEITCDIHKLLDYPIEQKPAEKQDYSGLTELEQAIHRGFLCAGVENVPVNIIKETAQDCLAHLPAEWSDDFDKEVENIHKRYPEVSYAKLTRIAYHFSKWANRCKGIEWSEEDEQGFGNTLWAINQAHANAKDVSAMGTCLSAENWVKKRIKSLRPQPSTVSVENATKFGNLEYERGVKDGIQSEKSRQWKPSEEQMGALNEMILTGGLSYVGQEGVLISLRNDLKRL